MIPKIGLAALICNTQQTQGQNATGIIMTWLVAIYSQPNCPACCISTGNVTHMDCNHCIYSYQQQCHIVIIYIELLLYYNHNSIGKLPSI